MKYHCLSFAVKEQYPLDRAKESTGPPDAEKLLEIFKNSKPNDNLKKILNPNLGTCCVLTKLILFDWKNLLSVCIT